MLEVLWPTFKPKTTGNVRLFDSKMKRRLYMVIDAEPALVKPFNPYDRFSPTMKLTVDDDVLKKYEAHGLRNMEYLGSHDEDWFVTNDRRFYTSCVGLGSNMPNPECTAQINVLVDVKIFVRFSTDYFDDLPKIVGQIEEFFKAHEIVDNNALP